MPASPKLPALQAYEGRSIPDDASASPGKPDVWHHPLQVGAILWAFATLSYTPEALLEGLAQGWAGGKGGEGCSRAPSTHTCAVTHGGRQDRCLCQAGAYFLAPLLPF